MAPRVRGATIDAFQEHWRTSHADAAGQIPNVVRYTQNHSIVEAGRYLLPYPGFDACSELDFESVEAMEEGFASETYRTTVMSDEREFVDKTRFSMLIGRSVLDEGSGGDVKLLTLMRAHPTAGVTGLVATLTGRYAETVRGVTRHQVFAIEPAGHRSVPASFAAVDILWFDDRPALDAWLTSDAWAAATWELAGRASGVAQVAAVPVAVV
jgi:uncharacterized protein (TIGR02118 family)